MTYVSDSIEQWLTSYSEANPRRSAYAFCIDKQHPGYFDLCFKTSPKAPVKSWVWLLPHYPLTIACESCTWRFYVEREYLSGYECIDKWLQAALYSSLEGSREEKMITREIFGLRITTRNAGR